jgi:hypothetical protein
MGPTHDGPLLLQRTMMGGPVEVFPVAPGGEGRTYLFPGRHGTESPPTSTMTIPWLENPPTDHAMTTIPPWQETSRLNDNLPLER